jgi:hypothetical protein
MKSLAIDSVKTYISREIILILRRKCGSCIGNIHHPFFGLGQRNHDEGPLMKLEAKFKLFLLMNPVTSRENLLKL